MVFDSLNEELENERKGGEKGKVYSWEVRGENRKNDNRSKYIEILAICQQKVLENAANLCGFIHDKEEDTNNSYLDQLYLNQIRDDRMNRMLAIEVFETEFLWLQYHDEEAQVTLEIADAIYNQIINETTLHLHSLINQRARNNYFTHLN